jgi:hypothetical protein
MTKRKILLFLNLVALLTALMLALDPVQAQEPTAEASPTPPPFERRFGIVDSFVNTAEANAASAGWTRIFLRWDVVQPGGPSDWKPTNVPDTLLDAEIGAGREIVAVLIGTPTWATESGASTAVPPQEYWGDFVYKIATQYKGRINHWVIWNQPDVDDPTAPSHTWGGSVEDYYRLLKEAYQKIKAVDPAMQVHLAGLTYTWDRDRTKPQYLARLLDIIKADPQAAAENYYFDAVSYHLYYQPRQIFDILSDVRAILNAHGLNNKPIWLNETNAPPSEDSLEPLNTPGAASITLEEQSAFVIQAFALALAGGAERIAFYKMRNDYPHPESVEPYGLLRADNSRRPAFAAFRTAATYFAATQLATWQQQNDISIVTLDQGDQTTTVLWNTSATAAFFTLSAIAPQANLVDDQGNVQPLTPTNGAHIVGLPGAECSNGPQNCFIGGAPRLVIEAGSANLRPALSPPGNIALSTTPTPAVPNNAPTPEASATPTPIPPPTLTPTPAPPISATNAGGQEGVVVDRATSAQNLSGSDTTQILAPAASLDDPATEQTQNTTAPGSTPIPPVTLATVLRPERLFWLFVIGLVVFTLSYGIQVVIWYRLRR